MLMIPGISPAALAACLMQAAALLIMVAGFALMLGFRKLSARLGALGALAVLTVALSVHIQ